MTSDADLDTANPRIQTKSPYGDVPDADVACADCGAYTELVGPLLFDGTVAHTGDFVCKPCARQRGACNV